MHRLFRLAALALLTFVAVGTNSASEAQEFGCMTDHAYGEEVHSGEYLLDLLCKPVLTETLEIPPDESILVTVNLNNYYVATDSSRADFSFHFAMQRARLLVKQEGSVGGEEIMDSDGIIQDISLITSEASYAVIIENKGSRSAIFDLSLRIN
ncbi:MAG: hypothetical protein K8J31_20950 [Anaerolineae bacterium]|nr:hypothetical protein [Anaerolineae bacterium]